MSEYTRKITITFENRESANLLFQHLSVKWRDISLDDINVVVIDSWSIVENLWYAICDVDIPDALVSIKLERIEQSPQKTER